MTRERGATSANVSENALESFHETMIRRGKNMKYYFTELNKGVHSYWVNSDNDIPILRATTILQARKASRAFPENDYQYSMTPVIAAGIDGATLADLTEVS